MLHEFSTPKGVVLIRLDQITLLAHEGTQVSILIGREDHATIDYPNYSEARNAYKGIQNALSTWAEATS